MKKNTIYNVYYTDGANPSECLHTCSSLKDAKVWIRSQIKNRTIAPDNRCSEEEFASSRVAKYEVYEDSPLTVNENGDEVFHDPIYESPYFYTNE